MNRNGLAARLGAILVIASSTTLFGCASMDRGDQGQIIGGVVGGIIGSQFGDGRGQTIATVVGTLAGSMIGRQIGENMDDTDRRNAALALQNGQTGQGTTWVNPDNGTRYTVTPTRTFEDRGGPCREFRLNAEAGGEPIRESNGTACLQADGSWLIVG